MCTITSSIPIKQNMEYYFEKYMEIYNKNDKNVNNIICFREYWYYIFIFCMSEWIKITQMVQQVLINIFYYYNINYVFILVLYFVEKSSYNATTTLSITNQIYTTTTPMICCLLVIQNTIHHMDNVRVYTLFIIPANY
eukprot:150872_1